MTQQTQEKDDAIKNVDASGELSTEQMVVDYLRDNPGFFSQHPVVLSEMEIPHETGGAVSLIERQVFVLRDRNQRLESKLKELVAVARENEQLSRNILQLVIDLITSEDKEELLRSVVDVMRHEFNVDYAAIKLLTSDKALSKSSPDWYIHEADHGLDSFRTSLESNKPICGRINDEQIHFLFPDCGEQVKSAAFIPLVAGDILGFIGLGGQEEERFNPGMATTFLSQISELVSAAIGSYRE